MCEPIGTPKSREEAGGMLMAPGAMTDEAVARLKAGFTLTFNKEFRLVDGLILTGPVHFAWVAPCGAGGKEPGA